MRKSDCTVDKNGTYAVRKAAFDRDASEFSAGDSIYVINYSTKDVEQVCVCIQDPETKQRQWYRINIQDNV